MLLLLIAFIAGVLTVLAPCVLPLLPVIVGGSVSGGVNRARAYTVAFSLGVSVIIFTLLIKFSVLFINVPQYAYEWFSGGILIVFGIVTLFPRLWDSLKFVNTLSRESNKVMSAGFMRQNFWGDVMVGAALGPVFSTCSPTYFVILATVLPASFAEGFVDLLAYTAGLVLMLLFVSLVGQRIVDKLGIAADPNGVFRKTIGALFVVIGVLIFSGTERPIEAWLSAHVYDITRIEQNLLQARDATLQANPLRCTDGNCNGPANSGLATTSSATTPTQKSPSLNAAIVAKKAMQYPKAPELTSIAGYINTENSPITIAQFKGQKVVLIDFWTYSCINCQRTLPYLRAWYDKYHDQGLEIIGVHTPEFAFERVQANVEKAVKDFGLKYPSVLDNEYGTWNAFSNSYWPRKYLIDIDGFIVYDHAGEGNYEETERAIQAALAERAERLGAAVPTQEIATPADAIRDIRTASPETYFGSSRNENFGNGTPRHSGTQNFTLPQTIELNTFYLGGSWNIQPEYAETMGGNSLQYKYAAKNVYLVAGSASGKEIRMEVLRDGKPLEKAFAGKDIMYADGKSYVIFNANRLYHLINDTTFGTHDLDLRISDPGLQAYTFTFG